MDDLTPQNEGPVQAADSEMAEPQEPVAPWMIEREAQVVVAEESSLEEGFADDEYLSDDEDIWWKQTRCGGTIARDGDPTDTVSSGPISSRIGFCRRFGYDRGGKPVLETGGRRVAA